MLNLLANDAANFAQQLLKLRHSVNGDAVNPPELTQWLEYWNDAESVGDNLRKVQHWLQRA